MTKSDATSSSSSKTATTPVTARDFLRLLSKGFLIFFVSITAVLAILLTIGLRINLTDYRDSISSWATDTLQRNVSIDGELSLLISWQPEIHLSGIEVAGLPPANEQSYVAPLFTSGELKAKVTILPLLQRKLVVDYVSLSDIRLQLENKQQGPNWHIPSLHSDTELMGEIEPPLDDDQPLENGSPLTFELKNAIVANNISVTYQDQQQYFDWYLETLTLTTEGDVTAQSSTTPLPQASAQASEPALDHGIAAKAWQLSATGSLLTQPYHIDISGDIEQLINQHFGQFTVLGHYAGAELQLEGEIEEGAQAEIAVDLKWINTEPLKSLVGIDAKHAAPLHITTRLNASPQSFHLSDIAITSPVTNGSGFLAIELGDHNTIDGDLTIPLIDLRPWLQPEPMPMVRGFASEPQKSPLQLALDRWLKATSTNLSLNINEIKGLGTPINNISATIQGEAGLLNAPISADIANVAFRGGATLDATEWTPNLTISLGAQDSPLGQMAGWLTGMYYATGHLDNAELSVSTGGTTLSDWLKNGQVSLEIDDAYVSWGADAEYRIHEARLNGGMNRPFTSHLTGDLMGIPAVFEFRAGTLGDILEQLDWQSYFSFTSPALNITAEGLLKETQWQNGSWLNITADSDDVTLLNTWLGTNDQLQGDLNLEGNLTYEEDWIAFNAPSINLLESKGDLELKWKPSETVPFLVFNTHFKTLDFTQFAQFIDDEELPQVEQTVPTQGINLDVPILSNELVIADADIDIQVDQLIWQSEQIEQLAFQGRFRNGAMQASPFTARYLGSEYFGDIALSLDSTFIEAQLHLSVNNPDFGQIFEQLNITNSSDISLQLDSASLSMQLGGRTMIEFMEQAQLEVSMLGGKMAFVDQFSGNALNISLDTGYFVTGPDLETQLNIIGEAQSLPVTLNIHSLSLKQINDGRQALPIDLAFTLGEIRFNANTSLNLPIELDKLNLALELYTPSLSEFNPFAGVDLPPYGPINVQAELATDIDGYYLNDLAVLVNNSQLQGRGHFLPPTNIADMSNNTGISNTETAGRNRNKPDIALHLHAPFIQVNDFKIDGWEAWLDEATESSTSETATSAASPSLDEEHDALDPIISPDGLAWANAFIDINVDEVRSGNDWLGASHLNISLLDGTFSLSPLAIELPGGGIEITSEIKAEGDLFDISLEGEVRAFDYGVLARRIDPETDMFGQISTQFQLSSLANSPDSLMNNANGFIGFAAWPQEFEANLIDLWAVSLASAILPSFTDENNSVLNCIAAGIDIKNGELSQRDMLLDTTRIQVNGNFEASYQNRDFSLYLSPRSKRAQIFGLQTPIEVEGKFEDFGLNVPWSAIFETSVRFTTSPVISPLRWLVERPLEENGTQVCESIWQGLPR